MARLDKINKIGPGECGNRVCLNSLAPVNNVETRGVTLLININTLELYI